jgi:hypothetical protein
MPYADISSKAALRKFLGQEPCEWFKARGFTFYPKVIGFVIQHDKTLKVEQFDYSFNHEAIKMVMDQLSTT